VTSSWSQAPCFREGGLPPRPSNSRQLIMACRIADVLASWQEESLPGGWPRCCEAGQPRGQLPLACHVEATGDRQSCAREAYRATSQPTPAAACAHTSRNSWHLQQPAATRSPPADRLCGRMSSREASTRQPSALPRRIAHDISCKQVSSRLARQQAGDRQIRTSRRERRSPYPCARTLK